MNFDTQVDASGLNCPLPILRAKKALAEMNPGQVLRVLATDPGSVKDFAAFARQTGNELLKSGNQDDETFEFFLRRK
ncbi:MAG: sulfurtransferase TusA family protein [Rhodocyclaceae bacterium]|nr:sulfurtransferase TusA family protein [Rhodocyclaceae bacterium]MCB1962587.1 sulfurtransferase TusA family protein [Rhodocyclaceae bacterium]